MYKVRVTRFKLFLEVPSGTLNFFSLCNQECLNFFFLKISFMYVNVYYVSTWELNSFESPVGPSGIKSRRSPE